MSTATVTKPRGTVGSHIGEPQARPWLYAVLGVGLVLVVTPFVWMWDPLESTCRHASLSIL